MFAERPSAAGGPFVQLRAGPAPTPAPSKTSRPGADPDSEAEVAATLLDYLRLRLRLPDLDYASAPVPVANGWEAYSYAFRLQSTTLPPDWDRPLMLRIHSSARGLERARHEFQVQRHLVRLGYPAPVTLLLEDSCRRFGGPFLVMEQVLGSTVLDAMLQRPWTPLYFPYLMAAYQARLHALPARAFPAPPGSFLDRQFDYLHAVIGGDGLGGLSPGLAWLQTHRPAEPARESVLHLDFHPLNLIERPDGSLAVLDWTYADRGDPHADVATTLVIQECLPVETAHALDWLAVRVGRPLVTGWYLYSYRRRRPIDDGRLGYYRAWAALRALVRYAHCACAGPAASDTKPSLLRHLAPNLLDGLCRYFRRWSGVTVRL